MNYKEHLGLGIALQLALLTIIFYYDKNVFTLYNLGFILVFMIINPLFCDLDHREAKLREWVTAFAFIVGLIGLTIHAYVLIEYAIYFGAFGYLIYYTTSHRGYMHSIPFCLAYGLIVAWFMKDYFYFIFCSFGCYTHMIGDKLYFKLK